MKVAVFLALIALVWGAPPTNVQKKGDSSNIEVFAKLEQKPRNIGDETFANIEQKPRNIGDETFAKLAQKPRNIGDKTFEKIEQKPRNIEHKTFAKLEQKLRNIKDETFTNLERHSSDSDEAVSKIEAEVKNSDGVQVQRISKYSCLSGFHILAFTSKEPYGGSDGTHIVELGIYGHSYYQDLYDREGDDMFYNKGDLWKYTLTSSSCIMIEDIQWVAIHSGSIDGWNIESIVTMVKDGYGNFQVLTQDLDVNRWIDSDSDDSYKSFYLTSA